jgi:hypothetical protein
MAGAVLRAGVSVRAAGTLVRAARTGLASAGVLAVLGAVAWLVAAAAQRPSTLSPPSIRIPDPPLLGHPPTWFLGPLHGVLPGLTTVTQRLHHDLVFVLIITGVGWAVAWAMANGLPSRVLLGASALAQTLLVLGPPLPLTDVFNYELYARMPVLHGLNPYTALPVNAFSDPTYALSNWHHLSSPYGPLFTLLSEALVPFGAHGWLWGWKLIVLVCGVATVALVGDLAARLGASRRRAIAGFGLSPLLLIAEVGGLHNDVPAVLCLVAAAWCLVRGRDDDAPGWVDPAAGALVVAAAGIKPSFAIVVGMVVLGARHRPRALLGAAAAAAVIGLAVLVFYGGALPNLRTQGTLVTAISVPNLLGLAAGHGGADPAVRAFARDAILLIAAIGTAATAYRRRWALAAIGSVLFSAVLTLPWVMPWYLVWALPFIAIGRPRVLVPLTLAVTVWLSIGGLPQLPGILHHFGYFPTRLPTGFANHEEFVRLLQ